MKEGKTKVFNDPIHGHIELSELAVKVADTPQFQRLRDISQLGGVYYVFPGACSNRFEHCIGVAHLARTFVRRLQSNQPELNVTEVDALCVEIAGLCHDLGHGPFSHLYDGKFLPLVLGNHDFEHEHASIGILDILIEENNLFPVFQAYGMTRDDIQFIKELILGGKSDAPPSMQWKGRGTKTFLYDIVANKRNGIDVDKFDYFARDCHVLGLSKSFDALRLMRFARIFPIERNNEISLEVCFHTKEAWNIFELFHTRYTLHKRAYQHRVSNAIELMIVEALRLADDYILIPGKPTEDELKVQKYENGIAMRKMSECAKDFHAYWRLTEYVLRMIEHSVDPKLQQARDIIWRIRTRSLYPYIGETIVTNEMKKSLFLKHGEKPEEIVLKHLWKLIENKRNDQQYQLIANSIKKEDLIIQSVKMGYGKGNQNPVSSCTAFYQPLKAHEMVDDFDIDGGISSQRSTGSAQSAVSISKEWKVGVLPEESISRVIPKEFEEFYIRLFCKSQEHVSLLRSVFHQWCHQHDMQSSSSTLTPVKRKISSHSGQDSTSKHPRSETRSQEPVVRTDDEDDFLFEGNVSKE